MHPLSTKTSREIYYTYVAHLLFERLRFSIIATDYYTKLFSVERYLYICTHTNHYTHVQHKEKQLIQKTIS